MIDERHGAAEVAHASRRRMLHVINSVDLDGGIEVWLLHLLRHIDRDRFGMDALALTERRGALEEAFGAADCRVFYCANHRNPWVLRRCLTQILLQHGPYDIVASHVHYFGGFIMRLAAKQGVPIRIVHSRNDTRSVEREAGALRRMYTLLMRRWIDRYATRRVAISVPAAEDLFGPAWQDSCTIVHSARDFSAFDRSAQPDEVRRSLGMPPDALVLGHVGKLHRRKNHAMVIDVAAEVFSRETRARLLLVGDGPEEGAVRERAQRAGIADRVIFAGARADVPRLLKGAMDIFIFPSHHDGLGMAVVEAQAAGLPCVIATTIPEEIDVVPELIHRLPLSAPPELWAERVLQAVAGPRPRPEEALRVVCASDFEIRRSVPRLLEIYDLKQEFRSGIAGLERIHIP